MVLFTALDVLELAAYAAGKHYDQTIVDNRITNIQKTLIVLNLCSSLFGERSERSVTQTLVVRGSRLGDDAPLECHSPSKNVSNVIIIFTKLNFIFINI